MASPAHTWPASWPWRTPQRTDLRREADTAAGYGVGVFSRAGVVHLRVQRETNVSNLGNLLLYSLDDLEAIAAEKVGICQMLDEKWRKVYKANASRDLFTMREMRAA